MLIRKEFKFENAHVVRGCSSSYCRSSLHGHSYRVEVLFESNFLDNGQMVYDFGLMKQNIKEMIECFDHSITIWSGDTKEYIADMKKHSKRWVELGVSPSAEQFSRVIFVLIDALMNLTIVKNGEREVKLHSIIVHETATGYAHCFREDAYSKAMGVIELEDIVFSKDIVDSWSDKRMFDKIKAKEAFINKTSV